MPVVKYCSILVTPDEAAFFDTTLVHLAASVVPDGPDVLAELAFQALMARRKYLQPTLPDRRRWLQHGAPQMEGFEVVLSKSDAFRRLRVPATCSAVPLTLDYCCEADLAVMYLIEKAGEPVDAHGLPTEETEWEPVAASEVRVGHILRCQIADTGALYFDWLGRLGLDVVKRLEGRRVLVQYPRIPYGLSAREARAAREMALRNDIMRAGHKAEPWSPMIT